MTLKVEDADPDEILILTSISGLSAAELTLFTGEYARDGGYYQGRRITKRNTVFTFRLNPDYVTDVAVSDIRELLYQQFLEPTVNGDGVQVLLIDDRKPDRYIIGYTEAMPADIFSKDTTVQVSMLCVDPLLKSAEVTSETYEIGWVSVPVTYDGSADTGLEMQITVVSATPQVTVENNGVMMTLVHPTGFVAGDLIYINTVRGSRAIQHNGTDIMALLTGPSRWITLTSRANTLQVYGTAPLDGKAVVTSYSFRSAWWGI